MKVQTFNEIYQRNRYTPFNNIGKTEVIEVPLTFAGKNKMFCVIRGIEEGPSNLG